MSKYFSGYLSQKIYPRILSLIILTLIIFQFCQPESFFIRDLFRHNLQKIKRIWWMMLAYPINDRIISSTTQLAFTYSKLTNMPICVKVWQKQRVRQDKAIPIQYLLEGLVYNLRCAPGVYLGIAYLGGEGLSESAQTFQRGRLTVFPRESRLANGEYALVMKWLDTEWRLDKRLYAERDPLATQEGMEFVAREVASLHKKARISSLGIGLPESIAKKLEFNQMWFKKALGKLYRDSEVVDSYRRRIDDLMGNACADLEQVFEKRYHQGHVRRCHGDLKLANLWIKPASGKSSQRLLALDCIDFNPDFCHIDTLSDLAMLAVDLQNHLRQEDNYLVEVFTSTYFREMKENEEEVKPLTNGHMPVREH